LFKSKDYNYYFDKSNGFFARWGKNREDDPQFSPYGPEIADIEITTICNGIGNYGPCKFCYKANDPNGTYMDITTFQKVLDKFPPTLCQVALGADAKCESNPDIFPIMQHCLDNDIIPNITVAHCENEYEKFKNQPNMDKKIIVRQKKF